MKLVRVCLALLCYLFVVTVAGAQDLDELLLEALKDYVEEKAEDVGLSRPESEQKKEIKNVDLIFTGAAAPEFDVFESLYTPEPVPPSTPGGTETAAERDCFNRVQNKIAWNYSNNKNWSPANVKKLCRGTTVGSAPPACFYDAMFRGNLWGKKNKHTMNWILASGLCAGTNNSAASINCLKGKVAANQSLQKAVSACNPKSNTIVATPVFKPVVLGTVIPVTPAKLQEQECFNYVQGRIAWDPAGKNKRWADGNVKRLCKGTTSKYSPGNCFSYAMHKGNQWGKKPSHVMNWSKAIDLCEGISNAQQVTGCFKSAIASGKNVNNAIKQCTG